MHGAVGVDGAPRGDERLPGDLAAEDPRGALRRADAAEQVPLEALEVEERDEPVEGDLPGGDGVGRCPAQAWSSAPSRCTRIRFVDPEAPGGEPATITTTSPALNRPMDRMAWSTCRTIASVEAT